jgi:nucleoid-associated protein YgaU
VIRRAALVAFSLSVIGLLRLLGHGSLSTPPLDYHAALQWARERDAATIVIALIRISGLTIAWYVVGVVIAGGAAHATHAHVLTRLTDSVTHPLIRHALSGILAASMGASIGATAAAPSPPPLMTVIAKPVLEAPLVGTQATRPEGTKPDATQPLVTQPVAVPSAETPASETWTVQSGDNFWAIAERVLAGAWHRQPSAAEIDPYWHTLIDANRSRLADPANPDLVFAGQVFTLPPLTAQAG